MSAGSAVRLNESLWVQLWWSTEKLLVNTTVPLRAAFYRRWSIEVTGLGEIQRSNVWEIARIDASIYTRCHWCCILPMDRWCVNGYPWSVDGYPMPPNGGTILGVKVKKSMKLRDWPHQASLLLHHWTKKNATAGFLISEQFMHRIDFLTSFHSKELANVLTATRKLFLTFRLVTANKHRALLWPPPHQLAAGFTTELKQQPLISFNPSGKVEFVHNSSFLTQVSSSNYNEIH